ncbi:MAG TPA: hypothetical protein VK714_17680 [Myxococcota bacterium]|nr:hypothetical protein [Myxococcota bacterium]
MGEQERGGNGRSTPATGRNSTASERDAQLDAAIEATFPASDPVASFDFR